MTLYDLYYYQTLAIEMLKTSFRSGLTRPVLKLPTGSGKTVILAHIVASSLDKGKRVLFVVPYTALINQTIRSFEAQGIPRAGVIQADHPMTDSSKRLQIASVQTLQRRKIADYDLILVDECFAGNTMIDGVKIKDLKIGDKVKSYNHDKNKIEFKTILNIKKSKSKDILNLKTSHGHDMLCTSNHRFYNGKKYEKISNIKIGSKIFRVENRRETKRRFKTEVKKMGLLLRSLWCSILTCEQRTISNNERENWRGLLSNDVQKNIKKNNKRGIKSQNNKIFRFWTAGRNEDEQPHEKPRNKGKSFAVSKKDKTQAKGSRWKRPRNDKATKNPFRKIGSWLVSGVCSQYCKNKKEVQNAKSLQGGYCEQQENDSYRSRWEFTFCTSQTRAGREKRSCLVGTRLASRESAKQGDFDRLGVSVNRDQSIDVYDIEVEDNHNFFANGILVHNCHIQYDGFLKHLNSIKTPVIGVTATPYSKGLGLQYNNLLQPVGMKELINKGFLCTYSAYAPSIPDLSGVKTRLGDYQAKGSSEVMSKPKIVGDIVDTWIKHGDDGPTICFCVDVAHANFVGSAFDHVGVTNQVITAKTPIETREEFFADFKKGLIKILINVGTLIAGFDSIVHNIIHARPTKSQIVWEQTVGRGMRISDGKEKMKLFDHAGNCLTLGFPEDYEIIGLDMGDKAKASKANKKTLPEALPKKCPKCDFIKPAKVSECESCGFTPRMTKNVEVEAGELKQISGKKKTEKATQQEKQQFYNEIMGLRAEQCFTGKAKADGYYKHIFRDKFGVWPNRMIDGYECEPSQSTLGFIKSKQIAHAKAKQSKRATA